MATLKETLKKLNKDVADADQFKIASSVPREEFDVTFTSFGSPYLDYVADGIGEGRMSLFVGWQGSGKSTFALLAGAEMQKTKNKFLVVFDGENTIDNSYMDRMGINRELLIHRKGNNLECMLNEMEEFSKTDDVGMIIMDSVKAFVSSVVEEKSAQQDTIGIEAKKLNARMSIINGNCARRRISLVIINQLRVNPGQMFGNPETKPGGHWQDFFPSLELHFTKKDLLTDEDKNIIGHKTDVRIKKSKYRGYDPKKTFEINLYYGFGFDKFDEYGKLLVEKGIIVKTSEKSSWFRLPNGEKIQGNLGVASYLEENIDYLNELLNMNTNGDN